MLRFTFSMQSTSAKEPEIILDEIKRVLLANSVTYRTTEPFCLLCTYGNVQFEMEVCVVEFDRSAKPPQVCKLPRLSLNGVRHKRVAGASLGYKNICAKIIKELDL